MTDPDLLEALRRRDPEAVDRVVRENAGVLLRGAMGLGLGQAEAEELAQAAFASFLEALPRFEGRSSVRTFLFGILYNKALERGRKQARELATDPWDEVFDGRFAPDGHWSSPPKGPDQEAEAEEASRLISECLQGLPEAQRAAFVLKDVEGEGAEEVRNALGVSGTHLRVLLFRARNKLRECLQGRWETR